MFRAPRVSGGHFASRFGIARVLKLNLLKHIRSAQVASCSRRVTPALPMLVQGLTLRFTFTVRV